MDNKVSPYQLLSSQNALQLLPLNRSVHRLLLLRNPLTVYGWLLFIFRSQLKNHFRKAIPADPI